METVKSWEELARYVAQLEAELVYYRAQEAAGKSVKKKKEAK